MVEDADPWDVVGTTRPRARKPHRCGECSRWISPGEVYERTKGIVDGHAEEHVVCAHCAVLGSWLVALCNGYIFGSILEDVAEHLREGIGGSEVARAWALARLRWGQPHRRPTVRSVQVHGRPRLRLVEDGRPAGAGLAPVPERLPVPTGLRVA